jgi:hypothetical protein
VWDYRLTREFGERLARLDAVGLGPELARLRASLGVGGPAPRTMAERLKHYLHNAFRMPAALLFRALGLTRPHEAVYEMLVQQIEAQLEMEQRLRAEIEDLTRRLERLEKKHGAGF